MERTDNIHLIYSGVTKLLSVLLGSNLTGGRDFSGNMNSDKNNCIINESLARHFSGRNLIGEKLPGYEKLTVIGIVKDFNCSGLKDAISPGVIIFDNSGSHLLVMPSAGQSQSVRKSISETWQKLIPDFPLNIESVKERYEWYHRKDTNFAKLIISCCLISLFLSMIGLFAISFHSSRKRTKEIGIRKINGATIFGVLALLNKDFLRWLIIAFVIASPDSLVYYAQMASGLCLQNRTKLVDIWLWQVFLAVTATLVDGELAELAGSNRESRGSIEERESASTPDLSQNLHKKLMLHPLPDGFSLLFH
ncbi:MAG: hypothetical protein MZV63_66820 [Marinilabiliales bacterium]|nr:hypothetical protein [Marinilabiliales bacterium]